MQNKVSALSRTMKELPSTSVETMIYCAMHFPSRHRCERICEKIQAEINVVVQYKNYSFLRLSDCLLSFIITPYFILHLISTNNVCGFRSVDAVHKLCRQVVAKVLGNIRCSVNVAMAGDSMVAEAVGVLYTQVQTLGGEKIK